MAIIELPEAFLIILFLVSLYYLKSSICNRYSPTNWPIIGMLPGLVQNAHRVHDFATDVLKESGGTFEFKGPWFSNSDMIATVDPANVHHIMSKNFANYPKGEDFREKFNILGDGIFNADSKIWEIHRKITMALMNHSNFHNLLERTVWNKVEKGLLPFLEYFCKQGAEFDLQDMFERLSFDNISKLVLDYDPDSLSIDLPHVPCKSAFIDSLEALLYRNILPESIWKLQKRLGIGKERKLTEAWQTFDEFIYPCVIMKRGNGQEENYTLRNAFFEAYDGITGTSGDFQKFMRDTFLSLLVAGTDTTSTALTWLFWLLSKNPSAEAKIVEEIETKLNIKKDKKWRFFNVEESRKLVYLHGALCESLRLYPPVALELKTSNQSDVFPSGQRIDPNTRVVISFYSMGRMETIWGNDCLEFKPERWISERGGNKHEPSYKFPAFNAGPRTCIGKEMAFFQMKMVAASIIYNYHIQVVKDHPAKPSDSIIVKMKHGLKIKLTKRIVS